MANSNDPNLNPNLNKDTKIDDNAPFDPLVKDSEPNPIEIERRSYESTIGVLAVIIVAIVAFFIFYYFQDRSISNPVTPVPGTIVNSVTTPVSQPSGTISVPAASTQTVITPTGTQTVTVPSTIQTTTTPTGTTSTVVSPTGTQTITTPTNPNP